MELSTVGQNLDLGLHVFHFIDSTEYETTMVAKDSYYNSQVSNMHCSIVKKNLELMKPKVNLHTRFQSTILFYNFELSIILFELF